MEGFGLLSDRKQQLFLACLNACENEEFCDPRYSISDTPHACETGKCEFQETKGSDVWVCRETGALHECGVWCTRAEYSDDTASYVCTLTGMVTLQRPNMKMGYFDQGADGYARPATALSGLASTRKRKAGDEDVGWSERESNGTSTRRTGKRIYSVNFNIQMVSRRLPSIATKNAGETLMINACKSIIDSLFLSESARVIMGRSACLVQDQPAVDKFYTACQYARKIVVHSRIFAEYTKPVEAEPLCMAVLYSWIVKGISMPPVLDMKPASVPWIASNAPPQKKVQSFQLNSNSACAVAISDITAMDKLLQEALKFWNRLAETMTLSELSRMHWVPVTVQDRVNARHKPAPAAAASLISLGSKSGERVLR